MSSPTCRFCEHRNPEGSKFCNECGSPLHLALCPRCEAVNNMSAEQCFQCGASLLPPLPDNPAALDAAAQPSSHAAAIDTRSASIPLAFAERLSEALAAPSAKRGDVLQTDDQEPEPSAEHPQKERVAQDEPVGDEEPVDDEHPVGNEEPVGDEAPTGYEQPVEEEPAAAFALDPRRDIETADAGASFRGRATYDGGNPNRIHRVFLAVAFLAAVGAVYWVSMKSADRENALTDSASTAMPLPAPSLPASPAREQAEAKQPAESTSESRAATQDSAFTAEAPRGTAKVPESRAAAEESASANAESTPPTPTVHAPVRAEAPARAEAPVRADASTPAEAPPPPEVRTAEPMNTASASNAKRVPRQRTSPYLRSKEQAERDAMATKRLIERQLGAPSRTESGSTPGSAP